MAFFWFLLFVVACLWALSAGGRAKRAAVENVRLAAERANFETYHRAAHANYQGLQAQYQGLQAQHEALRSHAQQVEGQHQRLGASYQALEAHCRAVQSSNEALQQQNGTLQEHARTAQQYAREVEKENQALARYRPLVDVDAEVAERRAAIEAEESSTRVKVEAYRRESEALKNVIDGYGDRYLVATQTLLDELGERYSHTAAGARLKEARQRSRELVKTGRAAVCDYVEPDRRAAAIAFVIDAFNGKVETTLAKAKVDNFGTLEQELVDAYALVNMNGRAFRAARILGTYLDARTQELKWAVALHELREQEREEQRRLKEQIREEEKARREYERAQKDAAKEEEVIRRAMAKAQAEIAHATDVQRQKYEAQLQELALRLREAEEKNQRALSMAQQTKRGHVYIISNIGSFGEEIFKIGLTRRLEPLERVKELGDASVPFEFDVHAMIVSEDAPALERALHRHFLSAQMNKVNPRKEFFRASLTKIREEVEKLGVQASWTMTAAAVQYRESMAIERAIANDPAAYQAWLNRQLVLDSVTFDEPDDDELKMKETPAAAFAAS